jgi:hypothetical protein
METALLAKHIGSRRFQALAVRQTIVEIRPHA